MHARTPAAGSTPALLLLAGFCLAGCGGTKTYTVQVDAISAPTATAEPASPAQSYHIRTSNPRIDGDSLRYQEVADYVRTALSGRGLYEAPSADKADLIIDIDYGMDAPRIKYLTISQPMMVEIPGQIRAESVAIRDSSGVIVGYRTIYIQEADKREFVGMQENLKPVIIYEKYLKLSARANQEAEEGRAPPEVWSVNVSAEDESQELRRYIPVLASTSADYIGLNTKQEKPVDVSEGDAGVVFVKRGL